MTQYLGDFVEDDTVYVMFNTFTSDDPSASCTITNFINTDVHIHKDGGTTQRTNAAGITVSVDYDGITGSHLIAIDTSDDTVAGFWTTGSEYFVRIEGTTVDAATINSVVGHFSIQNRFMRGTDSGALASALTTAQADLDTITGSDGVTLATAQALYAPNTVVPDVAGTLSTYDPPTNTEMVAAFTEVKGATWASVTDTLEHIRNKQTDIETDTAEIGVAGAGLTDLGGMSTGMQTEINNQVVDVVRTDTTSEMTQGAPPPTPTLEEMIAYIYFSLRNKNVETSTEHQVFDDAGTTILYKADMSDSAGVLTKAEYVSGV